MTPATLGREISGTIAQSVSGVAEPAYQKLGADPDLFEVNGGVRLPPTTKSPLRYPGGKSRAVEAIRAEIPSDVKELCSPFFGGGSLELACAADGIQVYGADLFEPVVNFWEQALSDPEGLAREVKKLHPLSRTEFYHLQRTYHRLRKPVRKAAAFYALNRSSFSGTTLSGGMSPGHPRFTPSAIDRLYAFRVSNLSVVHADYRETLAEHEDTFLYLDPPYANGERLYGRKGDMHEGFDHEELARLLWKRWGWILSYNDTPEIRSLYAGFKMVTPEWTYGMSNDKRSTELLIVNC